MNNRYHETTCIILLLINNVIHAQCLPPLIRGAVSWESSDCKPDSSGIKILLPVGESRQILRLCGSIIRSQWSSLSWIEQFIQNPVTALLITVVNRSYIILVEEARFCIFWSLFTWEPHNNTKHQCRNWYTSTYTLFCTVCVKVAPHCASNDTINFPRSTLT